MFKKVLFPIDQNRETRDAVAVVSNVVKTYDSKLFLLSVVKKSAKDDSVMSNEENVAKLLDSAKELFAQENIIAEIIEREGMPSFTICDVADEVEANLIIMGCRGLGLTHEGAEESVTNRVINLAPCPVLVVP
ncbi:MAG: universal stress protein [Cyanobacteria bacterium]|uniref:universal stress protein n=1 Tax=Geminocystis sp. TaxID=2664100 RepID=UPI001D1F245D|nr:universal stress protein [Cyanobacteria bacterium CG_2015-16_32_12]NCO78936.1 universal stress protein [Cyanobacteria bacterium CG_2015-22_32_23]NCQ04957.1 universal stress protein [Cyanobacteria bacterium CG_2015-09_32_10]NCQ42714.1 universal stress protein [Cyanobacteria bacterium CG_2015-04_32_10]NCS83809.1 universal stress protein [Cyanobacteria bacterium CG_2015-02_32_10]